ncbi:MULTISPECIES: hypothetical protein [Shouchella]|uniref:Flagellar operon protein (TIGR03826 family) n=2 Tax=Shouchella TaxID=2893057 RepID=A0ABY7WAG9_9BACI|nr:MULTISPECIES: hypothetical protein [Shouchella]MED4129029.1 hypothetical protein [Shouchella miscanthi]WDF04451.1 hypothetical protein PQ477_02955 [Shouchella hunanensis]GAF21768.1 flagellar protein [Bacillus sp. JCM 19047]
MQQLANCRHCGGLFVKTHQPTCKTCQMEEEQWLKTIRTYLKEHEDVVVTQRMLMDNTKIPFKFLQSLIRSGRLKLSQFPHLEHFCERCQKPTQETRFCHTCVNELNGELYHHEEGKNDKLTSVREQSDNLSLTYTLKKNR